MCVKDPTTGKWIDCHRRTSVARVPAPSEVMVFATHSSGMDTDQVQSIYERTYGGIENDGKVDADLSEQWRAFCDQKARDSLFLDGAQGEDLSAAFVQMRSAPPASSKTVRAVLEMDERVERAQSAMRRQIGFAAAMRGVSVEDAEERMSAYREQYLSLPAKGRPQPPTEWVNGFTTKDRLSRSAPSDPATLFAVYRTQADPDAFEPRGHTYTCVDLETAGPVGKEGFDPAHGCIIEVGMVTYDESGTEVDRYSTFVRPHSDAEDTYRTGAVAIHGIEWEDVQDAPKWSSVAPETARRLDNTVLIAQNDQFERAWLDDHLGRQGHSFATDRPGVDTMRMAQQHLDLPNHRLETICDAVGVSYTNGHRAEHDAEVTGQAFFAMRQRVFDTWSQDPKRASLPQPPGGTGGSLSSGDWSAAMDRTDSESPTRKVA